MNDVTLPKLSVLDSEMAYREAGPRDEPVALFLHGNPTSSFIWRKILPLVAPVARRIAPDLIGFGQSGKPDIAYRFEDHARFLDAFIAKMGIEARRISWLRTGERARLPSRQAAPDFVRGLAFMEFIWPVPTWEEFVRGSPAREIFRKFRTPGEGEKLIVQGNAFVERVLPGGMRHKLTDDEMAVYRAPFPTPKVTAARPGASRTNCRSPASLRMSMQRWSARMRRSPTRPIRSSVCRRAWRARPAGFRAGTGRQAQGLPVRQARRRHSLPSGGSSRDDRTIRRRLHR